MINNVTIMGRICNDVELKQTANNAVTTIVVAIDRNYTDKDGNRPTDFINVSAFGSTAEFISKFFGKGAMIAVTGELRSRTYDDKHGVTHYVTEVSANNVSFTGEKKQDEPPKKTYNSRYNRR